MRKSKTFSYIVAILALATFVYWNYGQSDEVPPPAKEAVAKISEEKEPNTYLTEFINELETEAEQFKKKSGTPGAAIAIVIDSSIVYTKGFGLKSRKGIDSVNVSTAFRIASVSKGFSAILTGALVSDSLLKWNDPIEKYLDIKFSLGDSIGDIKVRNILSHTGGFQYQAFSTLIEDELPRDTMIKELSEIDLVRIPGEIHSYQNVAYSIIEPILERISQKSFEQLMYQHIFEPLNMENASISYDSMIANTNKAMPHLSRGSRKQKISKAYYNAAAAGGVNASISDMSKYLKALLGNNPEVMTPSVLDSVFHPITRTRVKNRAFSNFDRPRKGHYGMGWRIIEYPNDTIIYHGGYANGYKSGIALDRSKKIGICILTNSSGNMPSRLMAEFFQIYKRHEKAIALWEESQLSVQ